MNFYLFDIHVAMHNSPGLLMAVLWIILAVLTLFFFFDLPSSEVCFIQKKNKDLIFFSFFKINEKSSSKLLNDYSFKQAFKRVYTICRKPVIIVCLETKSGYEISYYLFLLYRYF